MDCIGLNRKTEKNIFTVLTFDRYPLNMPLCAGTGLVPARCYRQQSSTGPVLTHNGMFTGYIPTVWTLVGYRFDIGPSSFVVEGNLWNRHTGHCARRCPKTPFACDYLCNWNRSRPRFQFWGRTQPRCECSPRWPAKCSFRQNLLRCIYKEVKPSGIWWPWPLT